MTEVRVSGNTNNIAVYFLEVFDVVAESNDLRRAHKCASTQYTTHGTSLNYEKFLIKNCIASFTSLQLTQVKIHVDIKHIQVSNNSHSLLNHTVITSANVNIM